MAQPAPSTLPNDASNLIGQSPKPRPRVEPMAETVETVPVFSPARQMQQTLGREFGAVDAIEKWPLRRTIAFVMLTCGAFWLGVYFLIAAMLG